MINYSRVFMRALMGLVIAVLAASVLNVDAEGAAFAAAATTGTPVSEVKETTTPDEHKVRDVSDALSVLEPSRFPFDTMMRRLGGRRKGGIENTKIEWARTERIPRTDTLADASAAGAIGETVTLTVSEGGRWRPNDLINLPNALSAPNLLVEEVNAMANTIVVRALGGGGDKGLGFGAVPAIDAGDTLARLGNSKTESDAPSQSRAMMPEYDFNLVHTYDAVVEISDHRKRTSNHTATDDWKRARQDNLHDLRKSFEYNSLFGIVSETNAENNERRFTQNGLVRYIDQTINYSVGTLSEASLMDMNKDIFTGNNGAQTRMLFADAELANDLSKIMLTEMQHGPERKIAGVEFVELRTQFGRLLMAYHPGLEELGYNNFGIVVDMNNVRRREMQAMEKWPLELKKSGQRDAEAEQYMEKSSLEVRRPDTHFLITGN